MPSVELAAGNNAEWCDAFCSTHGVAGAFDADFWSSAVRTPPYYPDAVTLAPAIDAERLLGRVDATVGCSVKDSFADIDLTAAGFRPLFSAEWFVRLPGACRRSSARGWSVVTEHGLRRWEEAWGESPDPSGFFRPRLLRDERIRVLACYDGDRVTAGAIANRSAAVIGLTNVFDEDGDLESAWAASASAANDLWGEVPVVGYDSGDSLNGARGAGFQSIGELVVWLNEPS